MKTVVKMFKERFVPLVEDGRKRQTIRPIPKRNPPEPGDRFSGREWTGLPYRSKQRVLCDGIVTHVHSAYIAEGPAGQLLLAIGHGTVDDDEAFARADGFESGKEMLEWFKSQHGLPFEGILIRWEDAA